MTCKENCWEGENKVREGQQEAHLFLGHLSSEASVSQQVLELLFPLGSNLKDVVTRELEPGPGLQHICMALPLSWSRMSWELVPGSLTAFWWQESARNDPRDSFVGAPSCVFSNSLFCIDKVVPYD